MAQENKPKLTGYSRFKPMQEELLKLRVDVKELEERNKVLEDALRTIEVKGLERFNDYSNGKEVDFKSLCGAFIETVKKTLY
jgi:hypothetical protein